VRRERFLVPGRIRYIQQRLSGRARIAFGALFEEDNTRMAMVVTFMALLEMIWLGAVRVVQRDPFGEIVIIRVKGAQEHGN